MAGWLYARNYYKICNKFMLHHITTLMQLLTLPGVVLEVLFLPTFMENGFMFATAQSIHGETSQYNSRIRKIN